MGEALPSDAKILSRTLVRLASEVVQEAVRDKANRRAVLLEAARMLAKHDAMAAELAALKQAKAA